MTAQLDLTGTTVTLFGDSDALDHALSDELGRRGCNTHVVTVPMGWLRSATHAVIRIDSRSGADALEGLAHTDHPPSHVIAVCPEQDAGTARERLDQVCQGCGTHHDVSLIRHPPLGPAAAGFDASGTGLAGALASTIADQITDHLEAGPAFVEHPFTTAH